MLCSYHVSQQNTFTGKLTESMLDDVFRRARELAGEPPIAVADRLEPGPDEAYGPGLRRPAHFGRF